MILIYKKMFFQFLTETWYHLNIMKSLFRAMYLQAIIKVILLIIIVIVVILSKSAPADMRHLPQRSNVM